MQSLSTLSEHIRELEVRLLQPDVRKSPNELTRLLADEFVEFASDGRAYDKAGVIEALQHETSFRRTISDFRMMQLADDMAVATYELARKSDAGEVVLSMRSSIWRCDAGDWRLIFHQGTVRTKKHPTAVEVTSTFWRLMGTNDFASVSAVLADDFMLDWPQTNERIRGADRFARMNREYPAHGPWRFTINRVVGGESEAVTDVTVTDGVRTDRAITFFTVREGKITRLVEFWPERADAPANRAHLSEPLE